MSNQPPYGNPPGGGYPPPPPGGGYPPPPGGGYPPPGGGYPPPGGGYPGGGGGYPPPGGNYPPPEGKTKTFGMAYNTAALLCYLPTCLCCANLIFSIIWMATEPKENRFVRFHALQGLLLFGVNFVIGLIFNILRIAMHTASSTAGSDMIYFGGGGLLGILQICIGFLFLIIHIMAMVKASQGQMWKLPLIGDIAEKNA